MKRLTYIIAALCAVEFAAVLIVASFGRHSIVEDWDGWRLV